MGDPMTTLTCACGSRLKVGGVPPGRAGRCPTCGGPVRVPPESSPTPAPTPPGDDEWNWEGTYGIEAEPAAPVAPAVVAERDYGWEAPFDIIDVPPPPPVAPRPAPVAVERREPTASESWFPPPLSFPARGVEGLVMVAALGGAAWVIGTLLPEYCLGVLADAAKLGASPMGYLVLLITATPALLLSPFVGLYWFQYLARVVVAAAAGERTPPRPPDRDLDGLLAGVGSWAAWAVLGAGPGLVPVAAGYAAGVRAPGWLLALGLAGLPYALMAFLLSFLHDEDLAARPGRVLAALARVGPSFLGLSLVVAGLAAAVGGSFAGLLILRDGHFWVYIGASLPGWLSLAWASIVAPQALGAYYYARRDRLRWRRPRAWWEQG